MARKRKPSRRPQVSLGPLDFRKEIAYIIARARNGESRAVLLGPLLFFSTSTRDAWMLDLEDHFAAELAREGVEQPVPLVETARGYQMNWPLGFKFEGDKFITIDKTGLVTTYHGLDIRGFRDLIRQGRKLEEES